MSMEGLKKAAEVFSIMQNVRIALLGMGGKNIDHQDIYLGQMLGEGHDAMKEKFIRLTLLKSPHPKTNNRGDKREKDRS